MTNDKYRMYGLVMYNLSSIQKGIQFFHAGIEYILKYLKSITLWKWAIHHKTVVIYSGGSSNDGTKNYPIGTMEAHYQFLVDNNIKCAKFHEPDLNDALSAIAFILEDKVYNKTLYPDFVGTVGESIETEYAEWCANIGEKNIILRNWLEQNHFRWA